MQWVLSLLFSIPTAEAAWPDASVGRIAAVALFREDMIVGYPMLAGDERLAKYKAICDIEKPFYPACKYKKWADKNGRTDVQLAAQVLSSKNEPLANVVAGWAKGFVNGEPSNDAISPKRAVEHFTFACKKKAYGPGCAHLGEMYAAGVGVAKDGKMAMKLYEEACKAKDAYGCAKRGDLYLEGNGVKKDYQQAFVHLSKGCQQGLSKACISLGYMHEYGQGVPLDLDKALDSYSRACESKNGMGCYRLAELHMSNKAAKSSPPVAMGLFSNLCELGDHRSCYGLGRIFEQGIGTKPNPDLAIQKFSQSCDANYAPACSHLGELHLNDGLIGADPNIGLGLVQQGCNNGDIHGCVVFAQLLEAGELIEKDVKKALGYYEQGCEIDEGEACHAMGRAYDLGEHLDKDYEKALPFYQKGCELMYGKSCGNLGQRYLQGKGGVIKNSQEALRYLTDGCNYNHEMSCAALGDFYSEGKLVPKDADKALNLYKTACDIDHLDSCYKAGMLIVNGEVDAGFYYALVSLEKSCKAGHIPSCSAAEPIMFEARFEGIVEKGLENRMCQVVTSNDDPAKNKLAVNVIGDQFEIKIGKRSDKVYVASFTETNVSDNKEKGKKTAQSLWKLTSGKDVIELEHHENWYYNRDPVQSFPKDESFSKEQNGRESIYFSREREVVTRNPTVQRRGTQGCKFVTGVMELNTEHCTEVQALLAAQLISICR